MIFFSRKKKLAPDLSWLRTDMHSHLIPGIDDGSPDLSTSLELIKGFAGLGYKKLITTPHVLWELYPNSVDIIQSGAAEVKTAMAAAGLDMELHAAAEYFVDEHFDREIKSKNQLLTLSGNLVLVEISMISAPFDFREILFELQMQNYQPVLAHPERYTYFMRNKNVFDELKASGCWFQVNLLSLSGYYGASVRELAEYLLNKNYYDLAGSDLHHEKHLHLLQKLPSSLIRKLQDSGTIKNHLL